MMALLGHAGPGFQGLDLVVLAASAAAPLVPAGMWLSRRVRRLLRTRGSGP